MRRLAPPVSERSSKFRNVISVDVEDYFHAEALSKVVMPADWETSASRVEANTKRILELFAELEVHATFFVLGWVAERHPALVREIAAGGHELACHSYQHRLIYSLQPQAFREDTYRAKDVIEQTAGRVIYGYRAPTFSIVKKSLWALEILAELGFTYDSSIFPIHHDRYGIPQAPRFPFRVTTAAGPLIEYPMTTFRVWGQSNFPVAGGGYLRLLPSWYTRLGLSRVRKEHLPMIVYVHPWEIDPDQPRFNLGFTTRLRHYTNLGKTRERLLSLLQDGDFTSFCESGLAAMVRDYDVSAWRENDSR
jgi:polysaccharide deacetylase family protein (PEP-CTERM system associated)